VRGTKEEKDELIAILRAMVYARSRAEYDALKLLFAKSLAQTMEADAEHEDPPDDDENDLLEEELEGSDSEEEVDVDDNEDARKRAVRGGEIGTRRRRRSARKTPPNVSVLRRELGTV
jgi:hypothetical protein